MLYTYTVYLKALDFINLGCAIAKDCRRLHVSPLIHPVTPPRSTLPLPKRYWACRPTKGEDHEQQNRSYPVRRQLCSSVADRSKPSVSPDGKPWKHVSTSRNQAWTWSRPASCTSCSVRFASPPHSSYPPQSRWAEINEPGVVWKVPDHETAQRIVCHCLTGGSGRVRGGSRGSRLLRRTTGQLGERLDLLTRVDAANVIPIKSAA